MQMAFKDIKTIAKGPALLKIYSASKYMYFKL